MRPETAGIQYRSRGYAVALNQAINVDLNFLQRALSFRAPDITEIKLVLYGTVKGAAGAAAAGRDAAKWFSHVTIASAQPHVDASGAGLRVNAIEEWGGVYNEPADVAIGATNAAWEYQLSIPFELNKSGDDRDSTISLLGFLGTGGRILINFPAAEPTGYDPLATGITALTMEVWVTVKEGRQKQVSSFLQLMEYQLNLTEDNIFIGGLLRNLTLTSQLTTTGYTDLSGYTSLDSRTLMYDSNLHPRVLRDRYRKTHWSLSSLDEALLATPGAIVWFAADSSQQLSKLPLLDRCHIKLSTGAVPASARFLVSSYVDRSPNYAAMAMGYNNVPQYLSDMMKHGIVRGLTEDIPASHFDPLLVNKMPLQIPVAG
jgi:hypothetical protein